MAFQITKEWIITLNDDFEHRVENERMVFWKTGATVICVVFRIPEDIGKLELLNQIHKRIPDDAPETLVSTKGEIAGLGYTKIENWEGEKNRLSLYTFTASESSCLQMAFYMDDPNDLEWAKSVWESTIYHPVKT